MNEAAYPQQEYEFEVPFRFASSIDFKEITKEQYLKECERGLEILGISRSGNGDVLGVSMARGEQDKPTVSYVSVDKRFLFTRGYPWTATPLKKVPLEEAAP